MRTWLIRAAVICAALFLACYKEAPAFAQMRTQLFELTLTGSAEQRYSQFKTGQRRSWGAEILVPVTSFFQLSAGHTYLENKDTYNEAYREFQRQQGVELPAGNINSIETYIDTTVNGVLYQNLGYVRPSIFGGALWRTYCEENSFADYGCKPQDVSWNAGAGISVYVTNNLRVGVSYRLTPSVTHKTDERLDSLTSLSLTLSY
jgi:opacity protein-like surface antigen